jgi:hypothetical protein
MEGSLEGRDERRYSAGSWVKLLGNFETNIEIGSRHITALPAPGALLRGRDDTVRF